MSYRGASTLTGPLHFEGISAPNNSALGEGRVYFDSVSNTFKVSQNAGTYVNLLSLQSSYEGGPSINTATAIGPVTVLGSESNDDNVLQVNKDPSTAQNGHAINANMGVNTTGDGIGVTHLGTAGAAIRAFHGNGGQAIGLQSSVVATGTLVAEASLARTVPLNPNTAAAVYSAGLTQFAGDSVGSSLIAFLAATPTRDGAANSSVIANLVLGDPGGVNNYDAALLSVFDDLVIGAIDPFGSTTYVQCVAPLRLSTGLPGAPPYALFDDGSAAVVSLAATGSQRYNNTSKQFEQSVDGGPWALLGTPAASTVTGATALATTQFMVFADSTGGAFAITLASAALVAAGSRVTIKDSGGAAGANNITLTPTGGQTIDGAASYVISVGYESIDLVSNGSNWFVV